MHQKYIYRSGLLGGDSEEKGDYMSRKSAWGVSGSSLIWVPQPWGLTKIRQAPLAGLRAGGTNRRTVGSPEYVQEKCA